MLLLTIIAVQLHIFVERNNIIPKKVSSSNKPITMTNYNLLQLDGTECDQFSTGGSSIVSVIVQALQTIHNNEALRGNAPLHIAVVSSHCIRQCLILQSVVQRQNVIAVVLSVRFYNNSLEVVPFMPPTITWTNGAGLSVLLILAILLVN